MRMGCRWHGTKVVRVVRRRAEHRARPGGYLQVRAMIDGKRIHASAHRLVWQYFFGNIPNGMCMNHKNGVKDDNRPKNLEVVTYSENRKHAFAQGFCNQDGERNPAAKLSNKQVDAIRKLYATGEYRQIELATQFGVAFQTISKIVRGERRTTQSGPISVVDHRGIFCERDRVTGQFLKAAGRTLDGQQWNEIPEKEIGNGKEMSR